MDKKEYTLAEPVCVETHITQEVLDETEETLLEIPNMSAQDITNRYNEMWTGVLRGHRPKNKKEYYNA